MEMVMEMVMDKEYRFRILSVYYPYTICNTTVYQW